jgi:hypothetical protein
LCQHWFTVFFQGVEIKGLKRENLMDFNWNSTCSNTLGSSSTSGSGCWLKPGLRPAKIRKFNMAASTKNVRILNRKLTLRQYSRQKQSLLNSLPWVRETLFDFKNEYGSYSNTLLKMQPFYTKHRKFHVHGAKNFWIKSRFDGANLKWEIILVVQDIVMLIKLGIACKTIFQNINV